MLLDLSRCPTDVRDESRDSTKEDLTCPPPPSDMSLAGEEAARRIIKLQNSAPRCWNYIQVRPNAEMHTSAVPSWNHMSVLCNAETAK